MARVRRRSPSHKPKGVTWQEYLQEVAPIGWPVRWPLPWYERYGEYLRSLAWERRRARVLRRDGYRCRWTGRHGTADDPLQVHHLNYTRAGRERLGDLVTVCRSAHEGLHGGQEAARDRAVAVGVGGDRRALGRADTVGHAVQGGGAALGT